MKICMPRGDIRDVRFTVYDHTGQRICTVPFDEIYVTFKNNTNTAVCLFQKRLTAGTVWQEDLGIYQFRILPGDTDNLKIGSYVFDIELMYADEIKQTTVGLLELLPEVTYAVNE